MSVISMTFFLYLFWCLFVYPFTQNTVTLYECRANKIYLGRKKPKAQLRNIRLPRRVCYSFVDKTLKKCIPTEHNAYIDALSLLLFLLFISVLFVEIIFDTQKNKATR